MAVNSAPINFIPGTQSVQANTSEAIDGLSIFDFDAGTGTMTTTLGVTHGTITIGTPGSVGIVGNGTDALTLSGTVDQINAALTPSGNVRYHGAHDFFGSDTLTVTTNDNGNSGSGSALSEADQVAINVKSLITGTPGDDTFAALPGNERIDAGAGIDTVSFNFKLTDAAVSYLGDTIVVDGPTGSHTVMTSVEVFKFTDGTVNNNDNDPLVDDLFYYSKYHDVWNAHIDADAHYHNVGWLEGREPNSLGAGGAVAALGQDKIAPNGFDYTYYLQQNPDVAAAGIDPLQHFETSGWKEGRNPNAYFDTAGYLAHYADVKAAGINPFDHYLQSGWQEGRDPSLSFDTAAYLAANPDVANAHINPLVHFLTEGLHEGRQAFADAAWG
jgi:serralysin